MDSEDFAELRELLAAAKRPAVQALLRKALDAAPGATPSAGPSDGAPLESTGAAAAPADVASVGSAAAAAAPTVHASAPSGPRAVPAGAVAPEGRKVYYVEPKFGWEQETGFVTVLIYDDRLKGVGEVKSSVAVTFGADSFDVIVPDLRGTAFRVFRPNLEKDIVPAASSFKVKKNSIELRLKKAGEWDHWMELCSKKPREAKKAAAADPAGGIMEVMRDLYESGDDATRKVIAEAWTKSREQPQQFGGGGGKGAGAKSRGFGGGFGGGLGGGLDDFGDF